MILLILPAGFAGGQDILPFEPSDTLEEIRYKIDHNDYSFEVSDNWVFSMSSEEKSRFFSRRAPAFPRTLADEAGGGPLERQLGTIDIPVAFDWRNYDGHTYIGPVRDQGGCGSCYAFGATAAAEGTYNWATGKYGENRAEFSEAFIAFCLSDHYSSHFSGCDGADYDYYELQALVDYGICTETQYPYTDNEQACPLSPYPPLTGFQSWHRVPCENIEAIKIKAIKTAIITYGVVDAAVYAGSAFSAYSSGIYEDTNTACNASPCYNTTTNHAIALVGWDDNPPEGGGGVWILRNSWGTSWGESGYMRIRYTSAAVSCAVCYLVYEPPTSPTPTPIGYRTPTPTPSITPTPEGFHTPPPSPTPSTTPSPAPYSIPFSENFEGVWAGGAPEGWMKEYIMGTNDWTQAAGGYNGHPASAHGGSYNTCFFYDGWSDIVTRLISPRLEFGPNIFNTRLTFWLAMEEWCYYGTCDQDELSVYYRTSGSGSWNLLTHYDTSLPSWTERTVDLPNPSNDYYICFQGTANYGYGICVDDLLVTGEAGAPVTPTPTTLEPTPSPTPSTSCDYQVSGGVYNRDTADPIPNAEVWLEFSDHEIYGTFTSSSDGYYSIWTCIPRAPGEVLVWASHPDYITGSGSTTWDCYAYRGVDIELDRIFPPSPTPTCGPTISQPGFLLTGGDYDGDGSSDPAVFRGSTGLWAIRGVTRSYFGTVDDLPVSGDYNGDGTTDIALFHPSSGLWAIRGISRVYYGSAIEFPCPSDYNGDGSADIAVFRGESGRWAVRSITRVYFGGSNDRPIPDDYTGSGTANIAMFRPADGLWALRDISRVYFGAADDWPLPGDYDGDGSADIGIFRPRSGGLWAVRGVTRLYFGNCLDWPVPADYRGQGVDDITIFRHSSGLWAVEGITRAYFGAGDDIPVTR